MNRIAAGLDSLDAPRCHLGFGRNWNDPELADARAELDDSVQETIALLSSRNIRPIPIVRSSPPEMETTEYTEGFFRVKKLTKVVYTYPRTTLAKGWSSYYSEGDSSCRLTITTDGRMYDSGSERTIGPRSIGLGMRGKPVYSNEFHSTGLCECPRRGGDCHLTRLLRDGLEVCNTIKCIDLDIDMVCPVHHFRHPFYPEISGSRFPSMDALMVEWVHNLQTFIRNPRHTGSVW